jgi:small-conductance mechanosensitive channel
VLLLGYGVMFLYAVTGRPALLLRQLVTLFWFIAGYTAAEKAAGVLMPPSGARKLTRWVLLPLLAILGLLHLSGLLSVLWTWSRYRVITLSEERIPLTNLWIALVIAAGFWFAAYVGKTLFLKTLLPRTKTDRNLASSAANFVYFIIVIVGLFVAVSSLGVEFSSLALLVTALTVGIGFGLQDVVQNFMGGMILLVEGYVRPNDVFSIGGETGVVERIDLRSTTVRTWAGAQVIIPNSYLITEKVSDLTGVRRVDVEVSVSNQADPRLVERLLVGCAAAHASVISDPAPSVLFDELGETGFRFTLYCHVAGRALVANAQSDLRYAIVEALRSNGVEMPYPRRDLHLRSGP